jgi:toxin ParE1/3/4
VKLRWTDGAVEDLRSAYEYREAENPQAAIDTADRIVSAVERLAQFPHMGRPGRVENSRELVVAGTPFIVAYRLKRDSVQVLAVLHGARKWPKKF